MNALRPSSDGSFFGSRRSPLRRAIGLWWLLLSALLALPSPARAGDDPSWSSGIYRADPGRNPFQTPSGDGRRAPREPENRSGYDTPWWNQERPARTERERYTPRIWDHEEETAARRRNRPWGEIPRQMEDEPPPGGRDRNPGHADGPAMEEEFPPARGERRAPRYYRGDYPERERSPSPGRTPYWDGPYQQEEQSDRYARPPEYRDHPDSGWRSNGYPGYDSDSWWGNGSRGRRHDSWWDPWEPERQLSPRWERWP